MSALGGKRVMTQQRRDVTNMLRLECNAIYKAMPTTFDVNSNDVRCAARRIIKAFPDAKFSTEEALVGKSPSA